MPKPMPAPVTPTVIPRHEFEARCRDGASCAYLGDHTAMVTVLRSLRMFVDTRDRSLVPNLIADGFWEAWVSLALMRLARTGDVALDIGAHVGYYTLLLAAEVGPTGHVVAWEPQLRLAELLRDTLRTNGFDYAKVEQQGAWNSTAYGLITYPLNRSYTGSATVEEVVCYDADEAKRCAACHLETVDIWASMHAPRTERDGSPREAPRVDLMKIDAEGSEMRVLRGAKDVLHHNPQLRILMEWTPEHDHSELIDFIEDNALRLYGVNESGGLVRAHPSSLNRIDKLVSLVLAKEAL